MQQLLLLQYNNYYNRIIKPKYNTFYEYAYNTQNSSIHNEVNFIPNDGVYTEQVINWNQEWTPDYCVVGENGNAKSRWFIIDAVRTRGGQYKLELKRDTISDNLEEVLNAPIFVEKAYLDPTSNGDVAIFNNEDMSFNQIKTVEHRLRDRTQAPWVVMYLPTDYSFSTTSFTKPGINASATYSSLAQYPYYGKTCIVPEERKISYVVQATFVDASYVVKYSIENKSSTVNSGGSIYSPIVVEPSQKANTIANRIARQLNNQQLSLSFDNEYLLKAPNTVIGSEVLNENGKYIIANEKLYKVNIVPVGNTNDDIYNITYNGDLGLSLKNSVELAGYEAHYNSNTAAKLFINGTKYQVQLEEVDDEVSYTVEWNNNLSKVVSGEPYYMIAFPYSFGVVCNGISVDPEIVLALTREVAKVNENVYDLQLLPYFPRQDLIVGTEDTPVVYANDIDEQVVIKDSNGNEVGYGYYVKNESFSFNIDYPYNVENYKLENETVLWRLNSPNYSSSFQFNAAKNNGIQFFKVDCTYKPVNPYIHVCPNFGGLYGRDFNDARGLICGGSFSLPKASDSWYEYEYRNLNYKNAFNRQIQNIEINNKYQKIQDVFKASVGTVAGGATGAMAGNNVMPGAGAIAGAAVGTLASGITGIADVSINEKLRNEALDLTKDNFGYQLQNIEALNQTLNGISAFDINSKYFVFLEKYECSDIEKEALLDKLKYNGYTIGRIGKINDFIIDTPTYFKGRLIRLENSNNDFHEVNDIAKELSMGVFI